MVKYGALSGKVQGTEELPLLQYACKWTSKPQALSSVWTGMSPENTSMDRVSEQTGKAEVWRKTLFRGIHLGKAAMSWLQKDQKGLQQ